MSFTVLCKTCGTLLKDSNRATLEQRVEAHEATPGEEHEMYTITENALPDIVID